MKRMILILAVFSVVQLLGAQGHGLYMSAEDFVSGRLSHSSKDEKIKLHLLFKKDVVEVKCHDTVRTYNKSKVFGYSDKEGAHRFYNNDVYDIVNPGENILIYKTVTGSGMKNSPVVEHYFFSAAAGSAILPLTLGNIEAAFAADKVFTKAIELHFRYDNELLEYDAVHHQYKLNRLKNITTHE